MKMHVPIGGRPQQVVLLGLLAILWAFLSTASASSQGFMVRPMRMEAAPAPGQVVDIPLEIRNTASDGPREIDVRMVELTQARDGAWQLIEPDAGADVAGLPSSFQWTELTATRLQIAPMQPAFVTVRLRPPANARGAYFAGIIAETPLPETVQGVVVRVRFLIPVIIEIANRPVRQQVVLADVSMTRVVAEGKPATTMAALHIANRGRTFSRVRGELRVERLSEGRWLPVTRINIAERSIIPGVTLELGEDLARRLPSGRYRLRGDLFVDGRRVAPLEKEIDFEGDPTVDAVAFDTALLLSPAMVRMELVPGGTRTTTLQIENPGTDPVLVRMAATTPRGLVGVEMGEIQGISFSAEPWTAIQPAEFTIRPGGRQNVRVVSRLPREGADHPHYYADLTLTGTYADGQSAGQTRSMIDLVNRQVDPAPEAMIDQFGLSEGDQPGHYYVEARLTNIGNVHLEPTARVYLLTPQGVQALGQPLSGDEGMLLPLNKRTYSAEIDLSALEPGFYALRANVALSPENEVVEQVVVQVDREEQRGPAGEVILVPRVTLVDPAAGGLALDAAAGAPVPLPPEAAVPAPAAGGAP